MPFCCVVLLSPVVTYNFHYTRISIVSSQRAQLRVSFREPLKKQITNIGFDSRSKIFTAARSFMIIILSRCLVNCYISMTPIAAIENRERKKQKAIQSHRPSHRPPKWTMLCFTQRREILCYMELHCKLLHLDDANYEKDKESSRAIVRAIQSHRPPKWTTKKAKSHPEPSSEPSSV